MGSFTGTARRLLELAVKNSGRTSSVQLPAAFARNRHPGEQAPQLSDLFRQGEVPLKLYLTLLMLTRKAPHQLHRIVADHYWAVLLGYEELNEADPIPGAGTRRIRRGMDRLRKNTLLTRERVPGRGFEITVVHPPGPLAAPYITIPIQLWSKGWLNVMSARALFVYLCLRLVLAGRPDEQGAHISSWDRKCFAISDDTWQRGLKELVALQLVRTETGRVATDIWSTDLHARKMYYLNNTYLREHDSPEEPVEVSTPAKKDL
ncbi:hypothetical protein BJY24_005740 [Nocardia transvalensis]|uniref:Uncharacterized protein n=1 Tax=Nocardia transvalensis TaxID=37333 RepID=A0A7W9PJF6_9NOCA|nr:hypothetical protein [Nocardia transvalensis]MBB5916828.1 hypothetical protein [Nocardia transvalensis]